MAEQTRAGGGDRIQTERLVLRPLAAADEEELHRLWSHREVARHLWDGIELPAEKTAAVVSESLEAFAERRFGLWAVRRRSEGGTEGKEAPELLGVTGFWPFHLAEPELVYALAFGSWGHGYATEMAAAALVAGGERFALTTVVASTDAPNRASIAVMERLGMRFSEAVRRDGAVTLYYRRDVPR